MSASGINGGAEAKCVARRAHREGTRAPLESMYVTSSSQTNILKIMMLRMRVEVDLGLLFSG